LEDINTGSRVGCKANDIALQKIIIVKFKEVKTGCDLAEYSKEHYDSKRALLPVTTMVIIIVD
jgi:hypothetical protein